jgi:hypothetical protein
MYEYRNSGLISNGKTYLISDGRNTVSPVSPATLDSSGDDVFIYTPDPLLAQDGDTQFDLYDARIGGGFPARPVAATCQGEACQGAPAEQVPFGTAGSASVLGGGNLSPPPNGRAVKPKAKTVTRAQKRAKALKACKHRRARGRSVCEAQVRKRYRTGSAVNDKAKG